MIEPLTPRELEVLYLLTEGYNTTEVAEKMEVSLFTAKAHAKSMRYKLQAKTLAHAVALAYHNGILIPKVKND